MRSLGGTIAMPDGSLFRGQIEFNEKICTIEVSSSAGDDYILPGFIDLQVNGSHGIDVMSATAESLATLGEHLAREGTTAWLPTAITAPLKRIMAIHAAIATAMENSPPVGSRNSVRIGSAILGMHLEGPFISPLRLGVHPRHNLEPRGDDLERVLAMKALRLITLAPELTGALDAIKRLVARGVVVSAGHTNATLEEANAGIDAGVRMFTHLFNAMRPMGHRDPGVIAAALAPSPALAAIIPDGVHVHPAMLATAYRARGRDGMLLVTDKVALVGTTTIPGDSGEATRKAAAVKSGASVQSDAARLADGTLAGSIISMLDGVRLMIEKAGVTIGEAAVLASTNPATLMGAADRGRVQAGARADLIVLNRTLELKAVFVAGREIG